MKTEWKAVLREFFDKHRRTATKSQFTGLFGKAYLQAFTPDTIRAAFSATGIYPFNPNVIRPEQLKPSEATSTTATFPLRQTSPVRAVMAAFRYAMPAPTDNDPTTMYPITEASAPSTPTRKRTRYEDGTYLPPVDPSLYTPSKRVRVMRASLASTSSGSFLVSSGPVTSSCRIDPPVLERLPPSDIDWRKINDIARPQELSRDELIEHLQQLTDLSSRAKSHIQAQNVLIEATQAQLVVQDLYARKLNETLFNKENRKSKDRTKLIFKDGKGRHLTHDEIVEALEAMEHERDRKEAEKKQRRLTKKVERTARQAAKAAVDAEWQEIKSAHEANLATWSIKCAELAAEGLPKSRWPKKPARPLKPKVAERRESREEEDSDSDDEGSDEDVDDENE